MYKVEYQEQAHPGFTHGNDSGSWLITGQSGKLSDQLAQEIRINGQTSKRKNMNQTLEHMDRYQEEPLAGIIYLAGDLAENCPDHNCGTW